MLLSQLNFLPEYTCLIHSCFCANSSFGLKQAPAFVDNVYSADENLATDNNIAPILFAVVLQNVKHAVLNIIRMFSNIFLS